MKPTPWAISTPLAEADLRHSIALLPAWEGQEKPYDYVRRELLTVQGASTWGATPKGIALHTDSAASKQGYLYAGSDWLPTSNVTIFVAKRKDDTTNRQSSAFGVSDTAVNATRCQAHVPWSDGTVYWDFGGSSGSNRVSIASLTMGDDVWAFRAGASGLAIFQNGISRASSSTAVTRTATTYPFAIGNAYDNSIGNMRYNGDLAKFAIFAIFDVELPDTEIARISQDVFSLIRMVDEAPILVPPVVAAANPKGPLGMPLHGPFAGPI